MYALKITGYAGDAVAHELIPLPADLDAAERVIEAAYRQDISSRVILDSEELAVAVAKKTVEAMAGLRRALADNRRVYTHPIEWVEDAADAKNRSGLYAQSQSGDWNKIPL